MLNFFFFDQSHSDFSFVALQLFLSKLNEIGFFCQINILASLWIKYFSILGLEHKINPLCSTSTSYITQKPCKESSRLLDLLPRNYILNSFKNQHYSSKTCILRRIHRPSNYSSIDLDAVRFPCSSLRNESKTNQPNRCRSYRNLRSSA
ncbi:hypothetical protein YC2023_114888 [Brassica napus]